MPNVNTVNHALCTGAGLATQTYLSGGWTVNGTLPSWFTYNASPSFFTYSVATNAPAGFHVIYLSKTNQDLFIIINIMDCNKAVCKWIGCKENIAWLNDYGGWSSYVFMAAKSRVETSFDIKGYESYRRYNANNGNINQYTQSIGDTYRRVKAVCAFVPDSHMQFLESFRYSPVHYLYSGTDSFGNHQWNTPIELIKESVVIKRCKNGLYEFNFNYVFSELQNIQTQ